MADPILFGPVRIPVQALTSLDWQPCNFVVRLCHHLLRLTHVLAMGAFVGGIGLLDFRLLGWRATLPLRSFALHVLPWLWVTFGVVVVTGAALFLHDPMDTGSHAYWTPKLIAIALGLGNATLFHRTSQLTALAAEARMPASARFAGTVSLACWTAAIVFSCLNAEATPKVLLR
jgi:hypothetical protein